MFSKYYQSELTYLRDMGRQFGKANPTIAGVLGDRGADPDVERLLEGFAFLVARTRERIDDCVPEVVHALTDLLSPHYLRSIPATSIVEFAPQMGALRGRHKVSRGTRLAAQELEGTSCTFQTSSDLDLLPLSVADVVLDESKARTPIIKIKFECSDKALGSIFEDAGIRLFLSGEYAMTAMLRLWFLRHCTQVHVSGHDPGPLDTVATLPADVIKGVGFGAGEALYPWPRFSPQGFRILQEYFTLPDKFLFIDVTGLGGAMNVAQEKFQLAFHFERPPDLATPIGKQSIRLHCVPVVNLFEGSAVPIRKSAIEHEHLLKSADLDPHHMEVYSIDSVVGSAPGRGERITYQPYVSFAHAAAGQPQSYYQLRKVASPLDGGIDTYFSMISPRDTQPETSEETFSIEALFTNRQLPGELRANTITEPTMDSPAMATFRNISEVTQPTRPPLGTELYWRLLSHLGLGHASMAHAGNLSSLVELYNFQGLAGHARGRANRFKAESIQNVESKATRRVLRGMAVRGGHTWVEVEEDKFAGDGDAYLFGSVLDCLLADHVSINSFNALTLRLLPSKGEFSWPPRIGAKPTI